MKIRKLTRIALIIITFIGVTAVMSWRLTFMAAVYGDTPLVTERSIKVILEYTLNLWHSEALGNNQPWPYTHLLSIPLLYLSNFVSINLYYFARILAILFSQITLYALISKFTSKMIVKLFSSILYVFNPVFITCFNMGGTLLHWVLAPLYVRYLYEIMLEGKDSFKKLVLVSMLLGTLFLVAPTYFVTYLILTFPPILHYMVNKGKRGLINSFIMITISLVLVLPYIYATCHYNNSAPGVSASIVLSDFKYTYRELTPIKFLLLIGNRGSPQPVLGYDDQCVLLDIGSTIAIVLFTLGIMECIIKRGFNDKDVNTLYKRNILITTSIFLIVVMFLRIAIYSDLDFLIKELTPLWTFRNPIKLQTGYALTFSIITGLGIDRASNYLVQAIEKMTRSKYLRSFKSLRTSTLSVIILCFIFLLFPVMFNSAVLQGDMGLNKTYKSSLGQLYDADLAFLAFNLSEDSDRGIIIPFDHKVELYVQFHAPSYYISRLGEPSEIVNWLEAMLSSGNPTLIQNVLRILSIKKVILYDVTQPPYFPVLNPRLSVKELANVLAQISLKEENETFKVFEIEDALPIMYVPKGLLYYSNYLALLSTTLDYFFKKQYAFLSFDNELLIIENNSVYMQYLFRPVLDNIYFFQCYYTSCYLKIWNSSTSSELMLNEGYSISMNLSKGDYKLALVVTADKSKLLENLVLDSNKISLVEGSGNFVLVTNVAIIKPGPSSWNSFNILLESPEGGVSYRIIFHTNGIIEIAKIKGGEYIPSTYVWSYGDSFLSKNLSIVMSRYNNVLAIDINGTAFHAVLPEIKDDIKIEIGSEESTSYLYNTHVAFFGKKYPLLTIFTEVEDEEIKGETSVYRSRPTSITLISPNSNNKTNILVLNERFNEQWEPSNAVEFRNLRANVFFNCFIIESHSNVINLIYKEQKKYEMTIALSLIAWSFSGTYLIADLGISLNEKRRKNT